MTKQRNRDKFEVSDGNISTLMLIPEMMKEKKWRHLLRGIVLDYITELNLKMGK